MVCPKRLGAFRLKAVLVAKGAVPVAEGEDPPGFLVRVEVRDYRDDRTMWSMELVPRTTPTHGVAKGGGGVRNEEGAPAGGAPSREDGDGDLFGDVD